MRPRPLAIGGAIVLSLLWPDGLAAQGPPLSQLIPGLIARSIVTSVPGHTAHFCVQSASSTSECQKPSPEQIRTAEAINSSLVAQLASSPPVSTSAGGFVQETSPTSGLPVKVTDSFGPIYAERPHTIGKGYWNIGFSTYRFDYDSIDSLSFTDGDLAFSLRHVDTNGDGNLTEPFQEGDLIQARTFLELSTESTVFFATWGITKRFDLAVAVPFIHVDLKGRVVYEIDDVATGSGSVTYHEFPGGERTSEVAAEGSASGVGDFIVRTKYNFLRKRNSLFSAAAEVRLPTGDEENLLGAGALQSKLFLIGSWSLGRFHPHFNLGYTLSSGGGAVAEVSDEVNLTFGFDAVLHEQVTFAADFALRTLLDATEVRSSSAFHLFKEENGTVSAVSRPILTSERTNLNLAYGSLGLKFNPRGSLLLSINFLYSLSHDGLQDEDLVPLIGLDYSF